MHYFDKVNTVMFVASLTSYAEKSEDGFQSGFAETLDVFSEVLNSHDLKSASVVVFLNKASDETQHKVARSQMPDMLTAQLVLCAAPLYVYSLSPSPSPSAGGPLHFVDQGKVSGVPPKRR